MMIGLALSPCNPALRAAASYGPERASNGTFASDLSGWTAQGVALATWSAGAMALNRNSSGSGTAVINTGGTAAQTGKSYLVTYDLIAVSNSVRVGYGGALTDTVSAPGSYSQVIVATGTAQPSVVLLGSTTATATVDNISVREVL